MSVIQTSVIRTRRSTEQPSYSTKCRFHTARVSAVTHENFYLINAHVPWRQLHKETALYSLPCSIVGTCSLAVRFCSFAVLFFVCDPACAVVLRMSSVTPRKRKRSVLSIRRKLEICDMYDKHAPCQASDLRNSQSYGQGPVLTCSDNWHSTVSIWKPKHLQKWM